MSYSQERENILLKMRLAIEKVSLDARYPEDLMIVPIALNKRSPFEIVANYTKNSTPREAFSQFIKVRKLFILQLERMTEKEWLELFILNKAELTLIMYMEEIIKHDSHHFKQIDDFLERG